MAGQATRWRFVRRSGIVAAVLAVVGLVVFLAASVAEDLDNLASARSDNQLWTITQAEVEFLEFSKQLSSVAGDESQPISEVRRRFDIFYSRVATLEQANAYDFLKADSEYEDSLTALRRFLDEAVGIIDLPDLVLRSELDRLGTMTEEARRDVRSLANNALVQFAAMSEARRDEFSQTLLKLALTVVVLLGALSLTIIYMRHLARQASRGRRLAQEEAHRTETVLQTSLDGVIVADQNGKILRFNAAAERVFGHSANDVIGKNLGPLIVPDHMRASHTAGMKRLREGGERHVVGKGRVQLEAKHKSGALFPVELAIQSAETDQGTVFIAFLRDITATVRAEQELIEARDHALAADRLKTEFLATMSHEIRTPLNGLLGNLTLIQDTRLSSLQRRYVRNMATSGDLLLQHVTDVLDLSRYDVEGLELQLVPVNLSRLLQSIVDSQSVRAAANNTVVEWNWLDRAHDWVLSDPDALQHIFINLVSNAVKFTHDGRVSISVDATLQDEGKYEYVFHVADTGQGISDDLKARIFDDFVTGSVAYDRNVGGTGLGLGIARRSVMALGGEIDVESEPGVGSTFEVRLILEQTAAVTQEEPVSATEAKIPTLSILLVEDNEINRVVAEELLARDGHKSVSAHDGAAAVRLAGIQKFDLILMDISMPVMDGRAATRAIRGGAGPNCETPILALTANAMKSEQDAFLTDGMNGILMKPLSPQALRDGLRRIFGESSAKSASDAPDVHRNQLRTVMNGTQYDDLRARFVAGAEALHDLLEADPLPPLGELAAEIHKILGSATVFGLMSYADALRDVEHAAKRGDREAVTTGKGQVARLWKSALETL